MTPLKSLNVRALRNIRAFTSVVVRLGSMEPQGSTEGTQRPTVGRVLGLEWEGRRSEW